ncbi:MULTISPECIES: HAD-IB family hydrolase [unclassified Caballeronia]|uniref:HAD-IB family hydrolase n=1 Tax=unclassified Caballeronia TaxID=2646786 RepID=UPI002860767F|nr:MULTISPECIES: HAD-IB family hydrolase [unclassified Caballeronia]MDR5740273.1 HAD-IB family hydrolase [Caballeronia sp. LZ016]MDR5808547.1 HAD-IB family hydrolase [Caballeronia sp. LZ019]
MTRRARTIAAFDFDGTITTGDSLKAFVVHTVGMARFLAAGALAGPQMLGMAVGTCDRGTAKAAFLRHALRRIPRAELERAARTFCTARLPAMIRPEMIERVNAHRALGHEIVLVSASPSLYLRIWASEMAGIGTLLSTQLELDDRGFTGRFIGRNCWGPEKVARLQAWWRDDPPAKLFAYGDSRGDKEMAELAHVAWIRGTGPLPPLAP